MKYYLKLGYTTISITAAGILTYNICNLIKFDNILGIAIRTVICFIVPNILIFLLNFKRSEFEGAKDTLKKLIKVVK